MDDYFAKLILLCAWLVLYAFKLNGEVVHITVLTASYTTIDTSSGVQYQCYRSIPDRYASLSFGRSAPITTDRSPPSDQQHNVIQHVRVVKFPNDNNWTSDGFGPFYCEAEKQDREITRVTTFFQRSDAKFIPSDGMFTQTVNVNDTGVVISMTDRDQPDDNGNVITWRKDGGDILTQFEGQTNINFTNPIQISDQGIYEIYYDGERSKNRGGIYRLIVRECPAGKWGPPECYGTCDNCYNGGVCDDRSGLCICPNNFMGKNCLEICRHDGGNRFGLTCEFKCQNADRKTSCRYNLFCLPDPYGCSCDAGSQGHACDGDCDIGTYGPGCSQTCHCANVSSCDPFSGICTTGGCQSGWSGNNCQECEEGMFGLDCLQQCHCAPEACDKQTGLCNGQCIDDWIEPYCQMRISRYDVVRVNPYQPSNITCYAEGIPLPDASSVDLRRRIDTNTYNNTGITMQSSSVSGLERAVVFDIEIVYPPEDGEYVCGLIVKDQFYMYSTSITNATYVLPVISTAPSIVRTTSNTVSIQWNAWSAGEDIGDPPLIGYDVFVRKDGDWVRDQRVDEHLTLTTVSNLTPDTDYRFRVAAVREGEGGTGPRSPRIDEITLCTGPTSPPAGIQVTANNPKELEVTWEFLSLESANCRSGVTHYMIYYALSGSSSINSRMVSDDTNSYTITGLETFLDYTVQMSASNKDEEGDKSSETIRKTLEEVAPAPINLSIPRSTTSSFTVTWSTPLPANLNGNIQMYVIRYQQTDPPTADNYTLEEDTDSLLEYTVEGLQAETNYSVQVQTVNGAGSSDWSEPINAKTIKSGVMPGPSVGPIVGGVMGAFIIIALVIILVFGILRKRRHQKEQDSMPNNKTNGVPAVIYENQEIVDQNKAVDSCLYDNMAIEKDTYMYEGVDLPTIGSTSKPAIQPRVESKNVNGKPVAVVRPEKPEPKERPPPQPKPFAVYAKEKADINLPNDNANRYEEPGKKSDKPIIVPRDRSRSQENLEESGEPGGDIYQNVASVKVILATDLEEYVKDKQRGQTSELAQEFNLISANQIHPWTVAFQEKNKPKNRFRNIIAYDHSRVVLEKVDGDPHSDYYNANYINDFKGDRAFIASQAPNTASLTAFWRMLWQENVATIVMVTNLIESGKDRCRQYWPKNPRTVEVIGDFSLFLLETEQFSDHIVRTIVVKRTGDGLDDDDADEEKRTITQYHYLSWPDMGVPEHYTTLINFTESVKKHHRRLQSAGHASPMLVHCSAGVGRTGTFICLYNMLDMMREEGKVDIFGFVSKMRDNRFKMVQTKEQYIFLYNALLEVYLSGDTEIPVAKFREKMNTLHRANSVTKKENIQVEFETLHALTPTLAANSFRSGRASINRKKNRFPDILPLERNRPYLASAGFADSTDYINASFMNTFLKKDVFLATQSPLPNTVVDLWRLVFDWKCPVIVMLNELDRDDCVQYWPEEGSIAFGSLEVTALESESTMNFVKRNLNLSDDCGETMTIEHFEMLGWGMSHNKPDSPVSLIKLLEAVEGSIKKAESKGPAIVHCINGIGRSGVFCALWSIMEKLRKDNTIDIFQAVKRLRSSRPNMVETLDQYELCYDVINQHLHQFEEYANLDVL